MNEKKDALLKARLKNTLTDEQYKYILGLVKKDTECGRWIHKYIRSEKLELEVDVYECDKCGKKHIETYNFCPSCGDRKGIANGND